MQYKQYFQCATYIYSVDRGRIT